MKLLEIIVGIILFSGVMSGIGIIAADLGVNYGKADVLDVDGFDQISEVNEKSQQLQEKLASEEGWNPQTAFDVLNLVFFDISNILFSIPNMLTDIIQQAGLALNGDSTTLLPMWFIGVLVAIVAITIVIKVVEIVTKREI